MKKSEILNWVVRGMSFILLTHLNNHHVYLMINRILLRVTKMFLRYFRKKYKNTWDLEIGKNETKMIQ